MGVKKIIFGRHTVCKDCAGRGWMARLEGDKGLRPASPSEIRRYVLGMKHARRIFPCAICDGSGITRPARLPGGPNDAPDAHCSGEE